MILLLSVIFVILIAEVIIRLLTRDSQPQGEVHYIILLGANGRVSSSVTQDRAHSAVQALKTWPKAKLVVTGNEKKGEITAYRSLLAQLGVFEFIHESQSQNTWHNMTYILPLIDREQTILVVTSEYHQPRALAMARSLGLKAYSYGKDRAVYRRRKFFFIKERLSNVRYLPNIIFNIVRSHAKD